MIVPEPDQISFFHRYGEDWNTKTSQLLDKPSPTLPLHFDKKYLPSNLCEKQYLDLFQCVVFHTNDSNHSCSYDVARFENCRKDRDIKILDGIKEWETKHIEKMDKKNRQFYMQGLTFKLDRLKDDYSRTPSTSSQQFKLSQIQTEIEQIKWRMKHIQTLL